jgi:hypothetical protein
MKSDTRGIRAENGKLIEMAQASVVPVDGDEISAFISRGNLTGKRSQ